MSAAERAPTTGFAGVDLPPQLNDAIKQMKFTEPTPIQSAAIPVAMRGADIIACAQTGTGKTAAFAIPALARLLQDPTADALVLAPTRELAQQVATVFQDLLAKAPRMTGAVLTGGASMMPQFRALSRKPRVIVATPGRLIDHLERGSARLDRTKILILDEADRMLDMGFAPQLERILSALPKERQTLLFSATLPAEIQRLAGKFMRNPERVAVAANSTPTGLIQQRTRKVRNDEKDDALLTEINAREGSILVFAATQRRTDRLAAYLLGYGVKVESIHGGRSQGQRNRALESLRNGRVRVLVATDVASRGLDVPCVGHVINYDLPMVPEDYVHRIGRTGRAGRSGEAISLVSPVDRGQWLAIRRMLHKASNAEQAARPLVDELESDFQAKLNPGTKSRPPKAFDFKRAHGGPPGKRRPPSSGGPGGPGAKKAPPWARNRAAGGGPGGGANKKRAFGRDA